MAWLSRVNFTASDVLSYSDVNNLGNDIRAWGGNVNGGGYTLSNVILSASSGTMATIIGGTGTTSTLTLRSTSGVGTTGADIIFQAGNNGATEVMRLQNGGNVGIGTSSPLALLSVGSGSLSDSSLPIQINAASSSQVWFGINKGGGYGGLIGYSNASAFGSSLVIRNVTTTDPIVFVTNNTSERMRILSTGEVGIGTPSPSEALGVNGTVGIGNQATTGTAGALRIVCAGGANYIQSGQNKTTSSAAPLIFTSMLAGSEWMRIDSSGNLLVGTTSSLAKLTAAGGTAAGAVALITSGQTGTTVRSNSVFRIQSEAAGRDVHMQFSDNVANATEIGMISGSTYFCTGAAERMRIDSVGNVKVGGTADRATTAGTNQVVIFNGTAPVGTLANGCSFYSTAGEMRVMDAAGNATLLSPHDSVTNEWIYDSSHTPSGRRLKINVERLLRFINDHFGLDCVHDLMEEA